MSNVYDVLLERGFVKQTSHEEEIREMLGKESVTFYIGFDATADSLHVGHFVQLMAMGPYGSSMGTGPLRCWGAAPP